MIEFTNTATLLTSLLTLALALLAYILWRMDDILTVGEISLSKKKLKTQSLIELCNEIKSKSKDLRTTWLDWIEKFGLELSNKPEFCEENHSLSTQIFKLYQLLNALKTCREDGYVGLPVRNLIKELAPDLLNDPVLVAEIEIHAGLDKGTIEKILHPKPTGGSPSLNARTNTILPEGLSDDEPPLQR